MMRKPRVITVGKLQRGGISPFEKFGFCTRCKKWWFGKPTRCPDCHNPVRNRPHHAKNARKWNDRKGIKRF